MPIFNCKELYQLPKMWKSGLERALEGFLEKFKLNLEVKREQQISQNPKKKKKYDSSV